MRLKTTLTAHSDMVMDFKRIGHTPLLATAGLDSKLLLWDLHSLQISQEMKGHIKGVFSLAYAGEQRLLFSASFDRDILVWNPMVETPVFRLKGHHHTLLGIKEVETCMQVVSADIGGTFKVWDW